MKDGAQRILEERKRQIRREGFTEQHDDQEHHKRELLTAALCYAQNVYNKRPASKFVPGAWPWDVDEYKPTPDDPVKQLVKAGALIAAEIDRLLRAQEKQAG